MLETDRGQRRTLSMTAALGEEWVAWSDVVCVAAVGLKPDVEQRGQTTAKPSEELRRRGESYLVDILCDASLRHALQFGSRTFAG